MISNVINFLFYKVLALAWILLIIVSCNKFDDIEKYQRPDWLVGKIYNQIAATPDLSMFAQCMADVGYDTLVNKTGTYTVFAPVDAAFTTFLSENGYATIEQIPDKEKEEIVKFHIVQMPWNRDQLQGLSYKGWINLNDLSNNKPFAFKRQTLLKKDNIIYAVRLENDGELIYETIVPEGESNDKRIVYSNSRKYAPIYFDDFLAASKLDGNDYTFYFNRNYEAGNIYFAGGKVTGDDIYADNGFIYKIDKVIDPLPNAEEIMDRGFESESYTEFKNLIYLFSDFDENDEATMAQEGADEGIQVDQLYDLTYPELGFDIHQELTYNPNSSSAPILTIEYHNGLIAPTNAALTEFVNNVLTGPGKWRDLDAIPANIKKLLVNSHMAKSPIYLKDITNGFFNASGDYIMIDQSSIIQKSFGSNATFIGLNKVITPKAFSSVSAPLYLNPDYQTFLAAIELSGLLPALKQEDINYTLFIVSDASVGRDMSMEIRWRDWKKERYNIMAEDQSYDPPRYVTRTKEDLIYTMYAQIAIEPLVGLARLEFLETLDGRHLVINNDDLTITGGEPSTYGYNGDSIVTVSYNTLIGDYFNGQVFETNGWPKFPNTNLHSNLSGSKFLDLLIKADMADKYFMKFTSDADRHTVFFPSDHALDVAQADTLGGEDLRNFLKQYFIKNEMIFTDGKKPSGVYNTLSRINSGNGYQYQQLNLSPGIDEISLLDSNGEMYYKIEEDPGISNIICSGKKISPGSGLTMYFTEAVVHKIDTVLVAY